MTDCARNQFTPPHSHGYAHKQTVSSTKHCHSQTSFHVFIFFRSNLCTYEIMITPKAGLNQELNPPSNVQIHTLSTNMQMLYPHLLSWPLRLLYFVICHSNIATAHRPRTSSSYGAHNAIVHSWSRWATTKYHISCWQLPLPPPQPVICCPATAHCCPPSRGLHHVHRHPRHPYHLAAAPDPYPCTSKSTLHGQTPYLGLTDHCDPHHPPAAPHQ